MGSNKGWHITDRAIAVQAIILKAISKVTEESSDKISVVDISQACLLTAAELIFYGTGNPISDLKDRGFIKRFKNQPRILEARSKAVEIISDMNGQQITGLLVELAGRRDYDHLLR